MSIKKYTISCDRSVYEAWPDLVLLPDGKLLCVFSECVHHGDRSRTRIVLTTSSDRGRSWSPKRPVLASRPEDGFSYNCARLSILRDGRIGLCVDRVPSGSEPDVSARAEVLLLFSADAGRSWSRPAVTPLHGIVPDKLLELASGRWLISAHCVEDGLMIQYLHYSDDRGRTWSPRIVVAKSKKYRVCEVSILPLDEKTLVAFLRENSGTGCDCLKTISHDGGQTWGRIIHFPLPGCHRPVAGFLHDGRIMITYRFMQGGRGWLGTWTQNFFVAVTDRESVLAARRNQAATRIMPVDYDRSPQSDLGYSGWVQFPDGEIYIAGYIADDAYDKGQIRGYSFSPDEFILPDRSPIVPKTESAMTAVNSRRDSGKDLSVKKKEKSLVPASTL